MIPFFVRRLIEDFTFIEKMKKEVKALKYSVKISPSNGGHIGFRYDDRDEDGVNGIYDGGAPGTLIQLSMYPEPGFVFDRVVWVSGNGVPHESGNSYLEFRNYEPTNVQVFFKDISKPEVVKPRRINAKILDPTGNLIK